MGAVPPRPSANANLVLGQDITFWLWTRCRFVHGLRCRCKVVHNPGLRADPFTGDGPPSFSMDPAVP
jgi:hypothetical protein